MILNLMQSTRHLAGVALLSGLLVGCSSIADMTAEYADTETVLPAKADLVGPIAESVVRDYGFGDVTAQFNKVEGVITGTTVDESVLTVTLSPAGARTTHVEIVNRSSKAVAEDVLREIERRLDAVQADPPPLSWLEAPADRRPSRVPVPNEADDGLFDAVE